MKNTNLNLENCYIVYVELEEESYSLYVYAEGYDEETIIDACNKAGLFEEEDDVYNAYAEKMTESDYKDCKDFMNIIK